MNNEQFNAHAAPHLTRRELLYGLAGLTAGAVILGGGDTAEAAQQAPIIRRVETDKKVVAFTFDDGPWKDNTIAIMNHFANAGLEGQATFFQTGNNISRYRSIGQEVADRGYEIGNHSMTHGYDPSTIAREIAPTQDLIEGLGVHSNLFRSPGLTQGAVIQKKLAKLGMVNVFTDYDIKDWKSPRLSAKKVANRTIHSIHPGSIVLLHDGGSHKNTVDAVPRILDEVLDEGFEVVQLGKMLKTGRPKSW